MTAPPPPAPHRVQLSRRKGWRMPPNTIRVARPSQWGNPFAVGNDVTRGDAVRLFRALVERDYRVLRSQPWTAAVELQRFGSEREHAVMVARWLAPLRGKNLACWCPLEDAEGRRVPCHADVLLEIANA